MVTTESRKSVINLIKLQLKSTSNEQLETIARAAGFNIFYHKELTDNNEPFTWSSSSIAIGEPIYRKD